MKKYIAQTLTHLKSKGRYSHLSLMKEYEYKSISECRELQKALLFNILDYSMKNVPFYKDISKKTEMKISKDDIFEDFKKFPILNKKILRNQFDNLKSKTFKDKCFKNTSGGSTGEPVIFLQDTFYIEKEKATKIFFDEWAGRKDGEKKIKLWGSERDILKGSQGINGLINTNLLNTILLNSFRMSESDMKKYLVIINKEKPKIIEAYVQSIYELSKFIVDKDFQIYSPKGIITSAGTLYPEQKKLIEDVFNTKVYNRYGSREVGDMACSCEKDEGLHLNIFNHYIEILNDKLEPCKPGEIGQIYVTTLNNYVMPLIRYQIGDMAVPAENKQCSCGRGLPLIKQVVGRVGSMIKTEKGVFDSTALTTSFYYFESIKEYQVVQKSMEYIVINIVLADDKLWNTEKILIGNKLKKILGNGVTLDFQIVTEIKPSKSGKYLYFISEVE